MHLIVVADSYSEQIKKFEDYLKKYKFNTPRRPHVMIRELKILDIVYRREYEDELLSVIKGLSSGTESRKKEIVMLHKLLSTALPTKFIDMSKVESVEKEKIKDQDFWVHAYILGSIKDNLKEDGTEWI